MPYYLIIGIGLAFIAISFLIILGLWNGVLRKRELFSRSMNLSKDIDGAWAVFKEAKSGKRSALIVGISITLLVIMINFLGFFLFISKHEHIYADSIVKDATCVEEGVMRHKCRFCDAVYEEPIATINHDFSVELERIEASCTTPGLIESKCRICDKKKTEEIAPNEQHQYAVASFVKSDFFNIGYDHYVCELCGNQCYSLKAGRFHWSCLLSIIVIIAAVIVIIHIYVSVGKGWMKHRRRHYVIAKPSFWISVVFSGIAVLVLVFHWIVLPLHLVKGNQLPFVHIPTSECVLVVSSRTESTYSQNGIVIYECSNHGEEYVEELPLKEFDSTQIEKYIEKDLPDMSETVNNGSISGATVVPVFCRITGKLTSKKDLADYYRFTLGRASNMNFIFSHDGDSDLSHWHATIYGTDGITVLYDDNLIGGESSLRGQNLSPGTYYFKISQAVGDKSSFSDADYYIVFRPECIEHPLQTQYYSKLPNCTENGELLNVCDECGTIISIDEIERLEHDWGEWNITKRVSLVSLGEKNRICQRCREMETTTSIWRGALFVFWGGIIVGILSGILCAVNESYVRNTIKSGIAGAFVGIIVGGIACCIIYYILSAIVFVVKLIF